jgi:3-hydroxybutyryl-CoA dehydrogenase
MSSIAEGMRTAGRVVGLHYFNPAHIMPLVEIHRGRDTSDDVVAFAREFMVRIGKTPILVRKEVPGFIVNRIQAAMGRETTYLIEEGVVTPEDLDTAAKASYGLRLACLGPMEQADMNGLDTITRAFSYISKSLSNATEPSPTLVEKVRKGEVGVKSGKGWHDYSGRSRAQIMENRDRNLLELLVLFNKRKGIK